VSAEHAKLNITDDDSTGKKLSEDEQRVFGAWLKLTLEDKVKEVKVRWPHFFYLLSSPVL